MRLELLLLALLVPAVTAVPKGEETTAAPKGTTEPPPPPTTAAPETTWAGKGTEVVVKGTTEIVTEIVVEVTTIDFMGCMVCLDTCVTPIPGGSLSHGKGTYYGSGGSGSSSSSDGASELTIRPPGWHIPYWHPKYFWFRYFLIQYFAVEDAGEGSGAESGSGEDECAVCFDSCLFAVGRGGMGWMQYFQHQYVLYLGYTSWFQLTSSEMFAWYNIYYVKYIAIFHRWSWWFKHYQLWGWWGAGGGTVVTTAFEMNCYTCLGTCIPEPEAPGLDMAMWFMKHKYLRWHLRMWFYGDTEMPEKMEEGSGEEDECATCLDECIPDSCFGTGGEGEDEVVGCGWGLWYLRVYWRRFMWWRWEFEKWSWGWKWGWYFPSVHELYCFGCVDECVPTAEEPTADIGLWFMKFRYLRLSLFQFFIGPAEEEAVMESDAAAESGSGDEDCLTCFDQCLPLPCLGWTGSNEWGSGSQGSDESANGWAKGHGKGKGWGWGKGHYWGSKSGSTGSDSSESDSGDLSEGSGGGSLPRIDSIGCGWGVWYLRGVWFRWVWWRWLFVKWGWGFSGFEIYCFGCMDECVPEPEEPDNNGLGLMMWFKKHHWLRFFMYKWFFGEPPETEEGVEDGSGESGSGEEDCQTCFNMCLPWSCFVKEVGSGSKEPTPKGSKGSGSGGGSNEEPSPEILGCGWHMWYLRGWWWRWIWWRWEFMRWGWGWWWYGWGESGSGDDCYEVCMIQCHEEAECSKSHSGSCGSSSKSSSDNGKGWAKGHNKPFWWQYKPYKPDSGSGSS